MFVYFGYLLVFFSTNRNEKEEEIKKQVKSGRRAQSNEAKGHKRKVARKTPTKGKNKKDKNLERTFQERTKSASSMTPKNKENKEKCEEKENPHWAIVTLPSNSLEFDCGCVGSTYTWDDTLKS